jgi:hypothetical protein
MHNTNKRFESERVAVVASVAKFFKQMNCPLCSEALLTLGVHMRRKGNLGLPEPVFFVESAD